MSPAYHHFEACHVTNVASMGAVRQKWKLSAKPQFTTVKASDEHLKLAGMEHVQKLHLLCASGQRSYYDMDLNPAFTGSSAAGLGTSI